ncbi:Asp23/Gls24 family envelope stress response protein [Parafrankia sp. FMc2]|uniref:Asp23/Gls24 family envelope stress response protein n=1 Tax=Parafrankia sp. FMc2 TaxID=3233196 RepID=UPI0034D60DCC
MTTEFPDRVRPGGARRPGSVRIAEQVVAKIAAGAAADVEGVTAPPPRLAVGAATRLHGWASRVVHPGDRARAWPVGGAYRPGPVRRSPGQRPEGWPEARAKIVDGGVFVSLTLSVAYPASVSGTAEAVRDRVRERVAALAGLPVMGIDIQVATLCGRSGAHPY